MQDTRVAKLFKNGSSQAVRLPADFRFEGDHVYATRNHLTGEVILSDKPGVAGWRAFFESASEIDPEDEFVKNYLAERPMNRPPSKKSIFDEE